jgi:hypothetical protein
MKLQRWDMTAREVFVNEVKSALLGAPRIYFAPLIGAIKEVRARLLKLRRK